VLSTTCTGIVASTGTCTAVVRFSPLTLGAKTANVRFAGGAGSFTLGALAGTSVPAAPVITSPANASGVAGAAFTYQITATNSPTSFGATGLPTGLSVATATGLISGTPSVTGSFAATITATNAGGSGTQGFSIIITVATVAPTITSTAPPGGTVGTPYSRTFTATGTTPITWSIATGTVPPGVTLNAASGVLSGTPTTAGTFGFLVQAANGTPPNATQNVTITIAPAAVPPTVALSLSSPTATTGSAIGLVLNISNPGTSTLTTGAFTFTYPAGVVTATAPGIVNSCSGTVTAAAGSSSVSASGLALGPSGTCAVGVSVSSATAGSYVFTFPAGGFSASTGSNSSASSATLTVTVATSPGVSLAPASVNFGTRTVSTTSPPTTVTLTNSGSGALTISSITGSGNFGFTSTCPLLTPPIAPAGSCAINITFTPLTVGALTGSITIVSTAPGSPHTIALSGSGSAVAVPGVSLAPAVLAFGAQTVSTSSAVQRVLVSNTGFANLTLSAITVGAPFSRLPLGSVTPPDCGVSVAPGSSCQIGVIFSPTGSGAFSGQISIADNATGSPHTVNLTGTGTPLPVPVISTNGSIAFGDQVINSGGSVQTLAIANTGTATLSISAITLTGTNAANFTLTGQSGCTSIAPAGSCTLTAVGYGDVIFGGATPNQIITLTNSGGQVLNILNVAVTGDFIQVSNCGTSLASLTSCTISILFTPLGQGARFGEFILTTSAGTTPDRIQLSGTGCRWFSPAQSRFFLTACGN